MIIFKGKKIMNEKLNKKSLILTPLALEYNKFVTSLEKDENDMGDLLKNLDLKTEGKIFIQKLKVTCEKIILDNGKIQEVKHYIYFLTENAKVLVTKLIYKRLLYKMFILKNNQTKVYELTVAVCLISKEGKYYEVILETKSKLKYSKETIAVLSSELDNELIAIETRYKPQSYSMIRIGTVEIL